MFRYKCAFVCCIGGVRSLCAELHVHVSGADAGLESGGRGGAEMLLTP